MTELTIRIPRNSTTQSRATSLGQRWLLSKWPSISERRSPTETPSNHIVLDRTRMPTYGMTELTIRIPRNSTTQSRATSLGQRWLLSKWPSISERRSPTETPSNHIVLDRTRMPTYGMTELTIRIPRNWMSQSRATSQGTEMATFKVAVYLRET